MKKVQAVGRAQNFCFWPFSWVTDWIQKTNNTQKDLKKNHRTRKTENTQNKNQIKQEC